MIVYDQAGTCRSTGSPERWVGLEFVEFSRSGTPPPPDRIFLYRVQNQAGRGETGRPRDLGCKVAKMVGPKKEALAEAEAKLKGAEDALAIKKAPA